MPAVSKRSLGANGTPASAPSRPCARQRAGVQQRALAVDGDERVELGAGLDAVEVVRHDLLGRDVAGAHALRDLVTAPLVHRGGSTRSRRYRLTPISTPPATTSTAAPSSRGPTASRLPMKRGREDHAPQRLRRVERRDDRDAPAIERDDQAEVGDAEADAGRQERPAARRAPATGGRSRSREPRPGADDDRGRRERDDGAHERIQRRVARGPADERVADREEAGAEHGQHRAERPGSPAACVRSNESDAPATTISAAPGDEARADALAEEHRREDEREHRRDADQHGGARGAGVADRLHERDLREAGHAGADGGEDEDVAGVDGVREGARDTSAIAPTTRKPTTALTVAPTSAGTPRESP